MELPKNAIPLYRVMTEKSRFDAGKFKGLTVLDVLKVSPDYIAYAYYSIEKISFTAEVLEKAGVTDLIKKPGKAPEKLKEFYKVRREYFTAEERMHGWIKVCRRHRNAALAKAIRADRDANFTRGQLQAANHGKIKL